MENNQSQPQPAEEAKKPKSNRFAIIFGVLILAGGAYGTVKYLHAQKHEETDDAQVESLISPVIPRVSGYIKEIRVVDNQMVKKGDTLIILDDRDYAVKLQEAEAGVASAQSNVSVAGAGIPVVSANVSSAQSNINTVDAQIEQAKVTVWRTTQDYNRYANLIKDHTITQQQYEQALAAKETAERQLDVLKAQRQNATRQTSAIGEQKSVYASQVAAANAGVKQRQAEVNAAQLNLSYTVITAAVDGQVSRVNLQPGQLLQAGQALFNIVPENSIWIVANFKETQLTKMKIGQKVIINVDAFPGHEFEAKLTSFSPATGSKFSLLPPDNSSGNFVKVVQRLPVKIEFVNLKDEKLKLLRAGMNVDVDVHLAE
jgi:membrane fusion protein (multidrug efflux system)